MKRLLACLAVCTGLVVALPAQEAAKVLRARNFFFDDYRTIMTLDLKAMRQHGVWDDLMASPVRPFLPQLEEQLGFELSHLDRMSAVVEYVAEHSDSSRSERFVGVFEGNAELGQPKLWPGNSWQEESVGAYVLCCDTWDPSEAHVMVGDKLRVHGPVELLRDVLSGKPRNGLPSADVLSLTADARGLLGHVVLDVTPDWQPTRSLDDALPDAQWPDGDRPTFVAIRLRAIGDEDDPHLQLELVLRHALVGEGVVVSERVVEAALKKVIEMPEARMLHAALKRAVHGRDGSDVFIKVDVGRSRDAMGLLAAAVPFLMLTASEAEAMQVLEVIEDVQVEEPPPPPPPEGGNGTGGGTGGGGD